jgi:2-polyprenyl-3-methyl-5-hydroxy-6-metoxy-1,4-benzoquinol methylase
MLDRYTRANRELWNDWTDVHVGSRFYDVDAFRAGACALRPLEVAELGDVHGKSLLHLQCHFGLDTLSWARRGAVVTGIDLSDRAIETARALADESGIEATFLCTPLYHLPRVLEGEFDIVFTSYGALEWLGDLDRWARIAAGYLRPGGTFYLAEIHPFAQMLDEVTKGGGDIAIAFPYFPTAEPVRDETQGTYADPGARVEHSVCYTWTHNFAEIAGALLGAGLQVEHLHEFPYSMAPFWSSMSKDDDGWWYLPRPDGAGRREDIPFLYSIRSTKPAGSVGSEGAAAAGAAAADAAAAAASSEPTTSDTGAYDDANRALWDELVPVHAASEFYDVAGFLAGRTTLSAIELEELAPRVAGTDVLHLQCHFGLDTLSLARLGARVTGVDFSGEGVRTARRLAAEAGLEAHFIEADVLQLDRIVNERFDVVFSSWGVLIWLPDLGRWAAQIRRAVRPGGFFYLAEFHPFVFALDDRADREDLRPGYPYFHEAKPQRFDDDQGDYADPDAVFSNTASFEWTHTLGDVVSNLTGAGLKLEFLHEFPHTRGLRMPFLVTGADGLQRVRGHEEQFPLSFSLLARG